MLDRKLNWKIFSYCFSNHVTASQFSPNGCSWLKILQRNKEWMLTLLPTVTKNVSQDKKGNMRFFVCWLENVTRVWIHRAEWVIPLNYWLLSICNHYLHIVKASCWDETFHGINPNLFTCTVPVWSGCAPFSPHTFRDGILLFHILPPALVC